MKASAWFCKTLLALACMACMVGCSPQADQAREFFENGMRLLQQGEPQKAELEFRNALQLEPALHEASYGLALTAEAREDWPTMLRYLDDTIAAAPAYWRSYLKKGQLLLGAGYPDAAADVADTALTLAPGDADTLTLRAAIALHQGDAGAAQRFAEAALARDERGIEALVILVRMHRAAGEPDTAIGFLEQALAREPDNPGLMLLKGDLLEQQGALDEAAGVYRQLRAQHPAQPAPVNALVRLYLRQQRSDAAEALLREEIAGSDSSAPVLVLIDFLLATQGAAAALGELTQQLQQNPDAMALRWRRVDLQGALGDNDAVTGELEWIARAAPAKSDRAQARTMLAAALLEQGTGIERARALIAEAVTLDPDALSVRLASARLALATGTPERAINQLRAILGEFPAQPETHQLLASAYALIGAPELAADHYRAALELSRGGAEQVAAYAAFLIKGGRLDAARRLLEPGATAHPSNAEVVGLLVRVLLAQNDEEGASRVAARLAGTHEAGAMLIRAALSGQHPDPIGVEQQEPTAAVQAALLPIAVERELRAEHPAAAHDLIARAVVAGEGGATPRLLQAWLLQLDGDAAGAAAVIEQVVVTYPDDPAAYLAASTLHLRAGRSAQAEAVLEQGMARLPVAPALRLAHAQLLELVGRPEAALGVYEELLVEMPASDIVVNNYASLLLELRTDPESAERAWQLARRFRHSSVPEFLDTAGWASHAVGRNAEAIGLLESARRLAPEVAVIRYHLGRAYQTGREEVAARREFELAVNAADTSGRYRALAAAALERLSEPVDKQIEARPPAG